jgi:hypothetical protein
MEHRYGDVWYGVLLDALFARMTKVEPMKKVATLVRRHLAGIVAWARTRQTKWLPGSPQRPVPGRQASAEPKRAIPVLPNLVADTESARNAPPARSTP